jgi:hypothetical protein
LYTLRREELPQDPVKLPEQAIVQPVYATVE